MHPDAIDRVLRKYARKIGLSRGYSAHAMRATFITTALENGASPEDVQKAAGHRDPSTTKLYVRHASVKLGNSNPSASFGISFRTHSVTTSFSKRFDSGVRGSPLP